MNRHTLLIICLGALTLPVSAAASKDVNPADIMQSVHDRPQGKQRRSQMLLTIQDAGGRKRERVVTNLQLEMGDMTKSLVFFESPLDVRNIGLLTIDYNTGGKADDQWLYLPKLRRTTRIGSSKRSGSFMGSDFTYGDMTRTEPSRFTYKLLDNDVKVDGEPCWLIEVRPASKSEEEESGFIKEHKWVSKAKRIALRVKTWVPKGKKLRYLSRHNIRQVDGIWTAHLIRARTMRNGRIDSESTLDLLSVKLNGNDLNEGLFNLRSLENGI